MLTGYQIILIPALIWETVYTISYGCAAFKKGRRAGGIAAALVTLAPIAVFVYLTFFQGE